MPKLTIDIIGLVLFLPGDNVAVLVDARKPRTTESTDASGDPGIITPHFPFIALQANKHSAVLEEAFFFDLKPLLLGVGVSDHYKVYALRNDRVEIKTTTGANATGTLTDLASVADAVGAVRPLKNGVAAGTDPSVIAVIDLHGATLTPLTPLGTHELQFGAATTTFANAVRVVYEVDAHAPSVVITSGGQKHDLRLNGAGPWFAVAGNVPIEELLGLSLGHPHVGDKLHHFEAIYDLYQLNAGDAKPVPAVTAHPLGLNTEGVCGPPFRP